MGSLAGFSIPFQSLDCCWRRFGHGPDRCQWNGRGRPFRTIHVKNDMGVGAPPCATFYFVGCDSAPNWEADTDVGAAESEPSPDT
jgi:hypothetical protein